MKLKNQNIYKGEKICSYAISTDEEIKKSMNEYRGNEIQVLQYGALLVNENITSYIIHLGNKDREEQNLSWKEYYKKKGKEYDDEYYIVQIKCSSDEWNIIESWCDGNLKERGQDILKIVKSKK